MAAVHEKEAAGAVGVLHRPLLHAHLSEERGLLVADDACNRDAAALHLGLAYDSGGVADPGHHGFGDAEEIQQLAVPLQGVDVEEHGPGCVGDVGHMLLAPGKVPDQPGIHGAEAQPSRAGLGHRARDVVEHPAYLGRAEIGVHYQPCLLPYHLLEPVGPYLVAVFRSAPVLPDYGVADRPAGEGVPDYGGLALVGQTDCRYFSLAGSCDGLIEHGTHRKPDFHCILLHPSLTGEEHGRLPLEA